MEKITIFIFFLVAVAILSLIMQFFSDHILLAIIASVLMLLLIDKISYS